MSVQQIQQVSVYDEFIDRRMQEDAYAEGYLAASEGRECIPMWFSSRVREIGQVNEYNYNRYHVLEEQFREGYSKWFE